MKVGIEEDIVDKIEFKQDGKKGTLRLHIPRDIMDKETFEMV